MVLSGSTGRLQSHGSATSVAICLSAVAIAEDGQAKLDIIDVTILEAQVLSFLRATIA